jgi:hypothetical protein
MSNIFAADSDGAELGRGGNGELFNGLLAGGGVGIQHAHAAPALFLLGGLA